MGRDRAHNLFKTLAADFARVSHLDVHWVVCPLCLRAFSEDALKLAQPQLTEEHIVPEELGGRIVTLTCKECNNLHGHEIDAHLIQMVRAIDAFEGSGDRLLRGRIEINGIQVPTDIDWKVSTGETTSFLLRPFNPAAHNAIREHFASGVETIHVNVMGDYIPGRAYLGIVRIAYLSMFKELGYSYILSPAADVVRKMLWQYENPPQETTKLAIGVGEATPALKEPWEFLRMNGENAVMVYITVRAAAKRRFVTFLPSPELAADQVPTVLAEVAHRFLEGTTLIN